MSYTIRFMDDSKTEITNEEFLKLAGRTGLVFIPSIRETINLSSISRIYPSENEPKETEHTLGVLHDGSRVVRQFGQWYCIDGQKNENGHYETRPDPNFFPEVMMDSVPSVQEYETKYSALPFEERKALMSAGFDPRRFNGKGKLESISSILSEIK